MRKIFFFKYNILFLIPLIGFLLYFQSLSNGFVLDDNIQLTENLAVHSLKNIPLLFLGGSFGGSTTLQGIYYKPLMSTVFTLLYAFFGASPMPFHLFQLIVHIINSLLVYFLLRKFFKNNLSLLLSLIFLVHPINSETVLYISALQDQLFTLFGLSALLVATKKVLGYKDYFLFAFLILLSLLSKEAGVLYLLISVVFRFIFYKKDFIKFFLLSILTFSPYLALRIFSVGLASPKSQAFFIMRIGFWQRIENVPAIILYYLKTMVFPKDLAVSQNWLIHARNFQDFYMPTFIILIILLALFATMTFSRSKIFIFFSIWFLLGVFLHSNLLVALDGTVSDRWMYFPIIGFLALAGTILQRVKKERLLAILIIILVIVLSIRTFIRSLDWKSDFSISSHDVYITKDNFALENTLGSALIQQGQYKEAIPYLEQSTRLAPYHWINWNNLGVAYLNMGFKSGNKDDLNKAEKYLNKAIENGQEYYLPYENMGLLVVDFRDPNQAVNFFQTSSKKISLNHRLWFLLAIAQYKLGDKEKAMEAAKQAYYLNPDDSTSTQLYYALFNHQNINIAGPQL